MIGHFSSYRHFMGLRRLTAAADDTLDDKDDEDDCIEKPGVGPVFGWIFLILYMFLAIAIVCDEFFVPSLECFAAQLFHQTCLKSVYPSFSTESDGDHHHFN